MIQSLEELCDKADGKVVDGSIRGAPSGYMDACEIEHNQTGEKKKIFKSDIEGGNFMFGNPDGYETLVTDVESVSVGKTGVSFHFPDDGSYHLSTDF